MILGNHQLIPEIHINESSASTKNVDMCVDKTFDRQKTGLNYSLSSFLPKD